MRLLEYKHIVDLTTSIEEVLNYMEQSGTVDLLNDCMYAVAGIMECLENNMSSVTSDSVVTSVTDLFAGFERAKTSVPDYEELNALLQVVREECDKNVSKKYKLLFVADIRGKWDSVSSVYEAVKDRADCEVDVVIQPIFRVVKLPEGKSRQEVLYEDYLTERGITHTLYKDYDMEKELPDITFISQPYESCTIPMFWPENIAKYSKLVYCPYYTATTLNTNISPALHSFLKMGVERYAWKIACQSEKMAQYYKGIGSQKGRNVVVSGLPKWDEVVNPGEELTRCPKSWKQKLEGKTVILWNTHYTVGNHTSDILDKGIAFLNRIKAMEGVALIWRPHPLTEMIIKAYIPTRYQEYLDLLKMVEDSDNMVMDGNSSYMPAFCCSDAMISDVSSLLDQYLFMNKPALMLVKGALEEEKNNFYLRDGLFDYLQFPIANNIEEQIAFIEAIKNGNDVGKEGRRKLLETFYPLADGRCGQRFVTKILADYLEEIILPTEEVYQGSGKILIAGALKDSQPCMEQLNRNGASFCFCEEFLEGSKADGIEVISLDDMKRVCFDLIVVTARNDAEQIRDFLIEHYNVCKERTLLFWRLYNSGIPLMVCDRVMLNPKNEHLDGIIIGIAHAETGILADRMPGNWCNLSVSSQDLYYQCKTLEYCVEKYFQRIRNLKYAVIDLFEYCYFNYDTSYCSSAVKYLTYGGFNLDAHNFAHNKLTNIPYGDIVEKLQKDKSKGITDKEFVVWQQVFPEIYECANYEGFEPNYCLTERKRIVTEEDVKNYNYNRSTIVKLHRETIAENVNALQRILQLLKLINPEIEIYTIVIPKYIEVEALDAKGIRIHEEYFNSMVEELQKQYGFKHLDFNKISNISSNRALYFDASHLNFFGALRLTDELKEFMFS